MIALLLCASLVPTTALADPAAQFPTQSHAARRQAPTVAMQAPAARRATSNTRLLVRFAPRAAAAARSAEARGLGYRVEREITSLGWTVIETLPGRSGQALMDELVNSPLVEEVEFDVQVTLAATPGDPLYTGQWGFENAGQTGGTSGADIDAETAWDITTGSSEIVVAVVDSGVDLAHPDLAGNAWVNPGEIPGNAIDDDDNGFVDDINGWDFANDDATVFDAVDGDTHGTHVAGTIGAVSDNGIGVVGMNWDVSIMSGKFLTPTSASLGNAIDALVYCVDNGADVINNSWSASISTTALRDAIDYAALHGVVCVAAAANEGRNIDSTPVYPASYDATNVVTVASTDHDDTLSSFSNYGIESVHLAAPGEDITSTIPSVSAALHVVEDPFEVMYFGFPIESIIDTSDRTAVFAGAMSELDPVGDGSVMIVDDSYSVLTDDGVGGRLSVYAHELAALGYTSIDTWDVEAAGMPTLADLGTGPVVWFTGGVSYYYYDELSLDSADRTLLGDYLDGGGRLLLSSGGAGEDLDYYFGFDVNWYRDYLHAICVDFYSWTGGIEGSAGGIFDSLEGEVDPYDVFGWSKPAGTDAIISYDASATPVIEWSAYAPQSGTSMAAPHVAGAIALIMSTRSGMSAYEAQTRIQATVDPIPSLAGKIVTGGRMNVAAAMTAYPLAPTTLAATPGVDGDMAVSWSDPTHGGQLATRLVRTVDAWPTGPNDGTLVYEGVAQRSADSLLIDGADVRYAAYALDRWGNWSAAATIAVTAVDTTAPDDPSSFTATADGVDVQLSWVNPADAGLAGVRVLARTDAQPTGPTDGSARVVYQGTGTSWLDEGAIPASQETTVFYAAYAYDSSTNYSGGVTDTLFVDNAAPTGTFVIDGGSAATPNAVVSLDSSVVGATLMRFDLGGGFTEWEAYADTSSGMLTGANGTRTIDAEYKDDAGNTLELSDSILLDTVAPTGTFTIDADSPTTTSADVSLDSSVAGATLMRFDLGGGFTAWQAYDDTSAGTLVGGDGTRSVYAEYKDAAGNLLQITDTIMLDATPPAAPSGMLTSLSGNGVVALEWTPSASPDVVSQELQRAVGSVGEWELLVSLSSSASGYTDTDVTNGATYRYRVRATDALGNLSAFSAEVSALPDVTVVRAAGTSRYETAMRISQATFTSADTVVVATGEDFPDALGAAGLAGALNCPVLLTPSGVVPPGLCSEIERLGAEVIIVGGSVAVGPEVEEEFRFQGYNPRRVQGANRYATAAAIAAEIVELSSATDVLIARGDGFADALAAGPLAYSAQLPVLLVSPSAVPWDTSNALTTLGLTKAVVLGGEFAVSTRVAAALGVEYDRAGASDRYGTAVAVAEYGVARGWVTWDSVGLATGAQFPDALGGGAALGHRSGVLLLTRADTLPVATRTVLESHAAVIDDVLIMGGEFAVSANVLMEVEDIFDVR